MQQLIPMTKEQEQTVESILKKINMQDYLVHFQMMVNGTVKPTDILCLLVVFYNTGYFKGSADAYEAENAKLKAIKSHIKGLGK